VCHEKGAVAVVDYANDDLRARVREITGAGVDVVIDPVGGSSALTAVRSTKWGARYVVVGFASGEIPQLPLNLVLLKGLVVRGFDFVNFGTQRPEESARNEREVLELLEAGKISPHVHVALPLAESARAMEIVADREAIGKVLIEVNPSL
jgi:NADPH2:quinone reductase